MSDATRFYWVLLHIKWKEAAAGEILKGADEQDLGLTSFTLFILSDNNVK